MEANYIVDVWRIHHPEEFTFTWKRDKPTPIFSRLDYFIATTGTMGWIESIYIDPGFKSDHSIIGMVFNPSTIERGKGLWKFNTLLIEDKDYLELVEKELDKIMEPNKKEDPSVIWKNVKLRIYKFSNRYAAEKVQARNKQLNELSKELREFHEDQCTSLAETSFRQRQLIAEIEQIYEK